MKGCPVNEFIEHGDIKKTEALIPFHMGKVLLTLRILSAKAVATVARCVLKCEMSALVLILKIWGTVIIKITRWQIGAWSAILVVQIIGNIGITKVIHVILNTWLLVVMCGNTIGFIITQQ